MSKQCGCKSPKPLMMPQEHCPFIPEYLDGACGVCGGDQSFGKGECVTLCDDIDGQPYKFIYKSLEDNNTTHPRMGKWQKLTLCEIINMVLDTPEATVDTNTTYTIQNNADGSQDLVGSDGSIERFNDKYCTSSAVTNPQTGATIVSRTCYKADGTVESGPTPYLTIEAGAVDTINGISMPDSKGCITITRPDLSTETVPTCEALKCSKTQPILEPIDNTSALFSILTTTQGSPTDSLVRVVATEVLPSGGTQPSPAVPQGPFTVSTQTICKDDVCAGSCADYQNGVLLAWELNTNNGDNEDGTSSEDLRSAIGRITISNNDGYSWSNNNGNDVKLDGDSAYRSEGDTRPVPFGTDGCITITTEVLSFPDPATMVSGFVSTKTSVVACDCFNLD